MDTNLTLELFIGRGMIDKSLAKDIKEEMIASGKELPEVLADFGIIGSKDDIWQMIASDLGTEFITLDNFQPDPNVQNMMPATLVRLHGALLTVDPATGKALKIKRVEEILSKPAG